MERRLFLLSTALCFLTSLQSNAEASVVDLTSKTFDNEIQTGVWFVKFYAPWCRHCEKLKETINILSVDSRLADSNVRVGKVDCIAERQICERFGVQSYPTLKVIDEGRFYDYSGNREVDSMLEFVKSGYMKGEAENLLSYAEFVERREKLVAEQEEAERSSSVVSITSSTFDDLVKKDKKSWIIKFYAPWCGHCRRLAPTWNRLSQVLRERNGNARVGKVDCTVHRRVCSRFGVNGYPTLFFVSDGQIYKYQGPRNVNALVEFISTGHKAATPVGPIPDETLFSSVVDTMIEWATEHTVMAIFSGILMIAIFVAILVALLDFCLSDDEYSKLKKQPGTDAAHLSSGESVNKPKAE
uniref:Thioredoxinlike protein putative n=1 Tax=Albugo laibachii Nc14 TaxID=890382 RepID=F0WZU1_9STRA|nr:thioredoxinlike protein putative [Albugo laibachii Nc14]|eukprot:CCA27018.1 thioredoxinlike protein putative [Albugo laibachii Nc14]